MSFVPLNLTSRHVFVLALDSQGALSDDVSGFGAYDVESIRASLEATSATKKAASASAAAAADPYNLDNIVVCAIDTVDTIYCVP